MQDRHKDEAQSPTQSAAKQMPDIGNGTAANQATSQSVKEKQTIILAAGGTGGHMFPARALATDLVSRGFHVVLLTDARGMAYSKDWDDVERITVASATFKAGLWSKIKGVSALAKGYFQSRRLVKKLKPIVVVGFGGYPSLPPLVAAQKMKVPTIVHEQNAVMGRANAYLADKADRIATGMMDMTGIEETDSMRCVVTGNPVRSDIAALYTHPYPALMADDRLKILVMGGSQGASVFSDVLPAAFELMSEELRSRLEIVQQCRTDDEATRTKKRYEELGVKARLETFIHDVADQLSQSHLVIARSGASTVAETTTAGRPAIFVPYPYHADHQQRVNAQSVEQVGGAWTMEEGKDFTADKVKDKIERIIANPEKLFRAAEASRTCARPDAARKLGNLVAAMAYGWNKDGADDGLRF